jgi:predicted  nucleic acid-binding Zn-ribbon protein
MVSESESLMLRILEKIQADVAGLKAEASELKTDMAAVKADVADIRSDIAELRRDMNAGFKAVLQQGGRRFLNHEGRIRVLERDVRTLKAEVRLGFRAMRTSFASVDERLDDIEARLPPKH